MQRLPLGRSGDTDYNSGLAIIFNFLKVINVLKVYYISHQFLLLPKQEVIFITEEAMLDLSFSRVILLLLKQELIGLDTNLPIEPTGKTTYQLQLQFI